MSEKDIKLTAEELKDEQAEAASGGLITLRTYTCPKCKKEYTAYVDGFAARTNPKCSHCGHAYHGRIYE